jgi:hypothetical protein
MGGLKLDDNPGAVTRLTSSVRNNFSGVPKRLRFPNLSCVTLEEDAISLALV